MQPILGRTLTGIIISLALSRKRGARQACFQEGGFGFLESLAHTHPFLVSIAYFTCAGMDLMRHLSA
jgi:hypothetical protein